MSIFAIMQALFSASHGNPDIGVSSPLCGWNYQRLAFDRRSYGSLKRGSNADRTKPFDTLMADICTRRGSIQLPGNYTTLFTRTWRLFKIPEDKIQRRSPLRKDDWQQDTRASASVPPICPKKIARTAWTKDQRSRCLNYTKWVSEFLSSGTSTYYLPPAYQ